MRVNLNREKLQTVFDMITYLLSEFPACDKAEELIDTMINKIRIKMRNRLDTYNDKNSYSVTIPKDEALAFFIWMQQMELVIPKTAYIFERTVTQEISNQVDKTYGTINHSGAPDTRVQNTIGIGLP